MSAQQPCIAIDGVFYQLYTTGIGRVWRHLLEIWAKEPFGQQLVLFDRKQSMPRINGLRYVDIHPYEPRQHEQDRARTQQVCDQLGVDLFISTYYSSPLSTPSVLLVHDMTPEVRGFDLSAPLWQAKHHAIRHARAHATITRNTLTDLKRFFPEVDFGNVPLAQPGVDKHFFPVDPCESEAFRKQNRLAQGYYLFIGARTTYKNGDCLMRAFRKLPDWQEKTLVFTGDIPMTKQELSMLEGVDYRLVWLERDTDLRRLYAAATALVAPSRYEGFGMPVTEAMSCGCPVIASDNPAHCEVGGDAFMRFPVDDETALTEAMLRIREPAMRESLIAAGLERAKRYSWEKMADVLKTLLLDTAIASAKAFA